MVLTAVIAGLIGTASAAPALPYDRVIVLGDSLSDTGNAGRFSNGPVWVEYLAGEIGAPVRPSRTGGTNFAVGGAQIHGSDASLRAQADQLLSSWGKRGADPRTLIIVYGGANDIRAAAHMTNPTDVVEHAIRHLETILADLAAAGAGTLLVPNLPDIGRTPEARELGPDWVREARGLVSMFNMRLEQMLRQIEARWPIRIHRLDVFGLLEEAAMDPERFGFRNTMDPCPDATASPDACRAYVFWDSMHPTTAGHMRLAKAAHDALLEARASFP